MFTTRAAIALAWATPALLAPSAAQAIEIEATLFSLGGGTYRYEYLLRNDGSLGASTALQLVDLLFDPALYEEGSLADVSSADLAATWATQFLSSAPGVAAAFDLSATGPGVAVGSTLGGFAVQFRWLGAGMPTAQPFEVYHPSTFTLLESGATLLALVPEPAPYALLAVGLWGLAAFRPWRQRAARCGGAA